MSLHCLDDIICVSVLRSCGSNETGVRVLALDGGFDLVDFLLLFAGACCCLRAPPLSLKRISTVLSLLMLLLCIVSSGRKIFPATVILKSMSLGMPNDRWAMSEIAFPVVNGCTNTLYTGKKVSAMRTKILIVSRGRISCLSESAQKGLSLCLLCLDAAEA